MSKISGKGREKLRSFGDHHQFLKRISKTLYYSKLPKTDRLSLPVTELASELFSEAKVANSSIERLHCNDAANISRNACVSPCSLVLALLYLDRLKTCNPEYLKCVVPSELFLVSLMVSSKFLFDDGEEDEVCLKDWAVSGGVSTEDLLRMERDFLNAIEWNIFVNEITFWKKMHSLEETIAKKQGLKRGWYTYTELQNLINSFGVNALVQRLASFLAVIMTAYTAAILTIVGSMYILSNIPGNCLTNVSQPKPVTSNHSVHVAPQEEIILVDIEADKLQKSLEYNKGIDALDVLKTSIILASIKSHNCNQSTYEFDDSIQSTENVSWEWWTNSALVWLSETSKAIDNFAFNLSPFQFMYDRNKEKSIAMCKNMELEEHIQKNTKTRIQDQMESSWHEEWIDTIKTAFSMARPSIMCLIQK